VPNDKVETLKGLARAQHDAAMSEYGSIDPGLVIEVTAAESPATRVMKTDQADRLVDVLCAVPHGVLAMSRDIKGLVETSNNLATIKTQDGKVEIKLSSRSSVAAALDSTIGQLCAQGRLAGIGVEVGSGYPGWKPNMSSKVLGLARSVFSEIWGSEPKVTAIHAGLECGLIGEKLPGMDMISFGPQLKSVHSPDEKAQISSSARFWEAVKMMLARMA
jgi:dipeptidase D